MNKRNLPPGGHGVVFIGGSGNRVSGIRTHNVANAVTMVDQTDSTVERVVATNDGRAPQEIIEQILAEVRKVAAEQNSPITPEAVEEVVLGKGWGNWAKQNSIPSASLVLQVLDYLG